ncbi:putative F-box protein isoform X1 [Salvia divinorum]
MKSILRLRAVCRFWRDVIDSQDFRKLHTLNDNDVPDDTVYIQVSFPIAEPNKVSIKLQHNQTKLVSYEYSHTDGFGQYTIVGSVNGLICISPWLYAVPIAICNPFLGQVKNLPLTSYLYPSCSIVERSVAIGFDQDYKVVQVLTCGKHRCVHAHRYSRTDSWREMAIDCKITYGSEFRDISPIKSRCKNGYFAHWRLGGHNLTSRILSLDMRKEVFWTVTLPVLLGECSYFFAEDEHSFRYFDFRFDSPASSAVRIYESRCEGGELSWNCLKTAVMPFAEPQWRAGFAFYERGCGHWGAFVYDYRARKFVCRHLLPPSWARLIEYRGSFVSI